MERITLAGIKAVIASSGAGEAIEALLPDAIRGRQLHAGTLLAGKMLALADGRPAHLTRAHDALLALPEHDQKRLGIIEDWKDGPHQLTYRQVEHTNRLVNLCYPCVTADVPGGAGAGPPQRLDSPARTGWVRPARICSRPTSSAGMLGIRSAPLCVNSEARRARSRIIAASVNSPRSASISTRSAIA
jgi:hypothetical protein